jgi:UDP-N-acetylglucosamine acyltransferase
MDQHPTALVSSKAEIGENVKVGAFSIIEDDVIIGDGCIIDTHVSIKSGTRLAKNVKVFHGSALGGPPQDLKYAGEKTELFVGDNTILREFVDLNRGTIAHGKTVVGNNCLLMAYSHAAHDCTIGDNVVFANGAQLGGHVTIGDWAILGGLACVHQFCVVGEQTMIGACFKATQDVMPYTLAAGHPLKCMGVNIIGLKRRGFSPATINTLKTVFRYLISKKYTTGEAIQKIENEIEIIPEVARVLEFVKSSKRGVTK